MCNREQKNSNHQITRTFHRRHAVATAAQQRVQAPAVHVTALTLPTLCHRVAVVTAAEQCHLAGDLWRAAHLSGAVGGGEAVPATAERRALKDGGLAVTVHVQDTYDCTFMQIKVQ